MLLSLFCGVVNGERDRKTHVCNMLPCYSVLSIGWPQASSPSSSSQAFLLNFFFPSLSLFSFIKKGIFVGVFFLLLALNYWVLDMCIVDIWSLLQLENWFVFWNWTQKGKKNMLVGGDYSVEDHVSLTFYFSSCFCTLFNCCFSFLSPLKEMGIRTKH